MAGIARPFIPWIGSKEKLIPYIWQVFPPNPKLYLEPFGGGGALLLGIQPKVSRMDIYNDFNCDLVNLFLCARECTIQLVQELKFLPLHSRAEFDLLKEFMKHKELLQQRIADERNAVMECFDGEEREELLQILRGRSNLFDVQRAAAYYKVCRGSFSGTTTSFGVKPNNITNFLYSYKVHPTICPQHARLHQLYAHPPAAWHRGSLRKGEYQLASSGQRIYDHDVRRDGAV